MTDRAPYSRVYWSVMDDLKFDGIREDPRLFGSWSLLLIVADMAWPAPAFCPPTVPKASFRALVTAELVDALSGGRFRIRGLDAERGRRRDAARSGGKPDPSGTRTGGKRDPNGAQDETRRDEAEPSRAETSNAGTLDYMPTSDDHDALDVYHELTGYRPWGIWSGDALRGLIDDYTDPIVQSALRAEHHGNGERKDLLDRLQARLARDAEHTKRAKPPKARAKYADRYDDPEYQKARLEVVGG